MMIQCDNSYIPQVIDYIGEDKYKCFYLYMDMKEYGAQGPDVGLWMCGEGARIDGVMYRYFDTLHLYSREIFPQREALAMIEQLRPKCVTGEQSSIDPLKGKTTDAYAYELSHIITTDKLMDGKSDLSVQQAGKADVPEIARLMMKEPIYNSVYTYESLCEQLENRIDSGFGRLFVMREPDGRLVATNATSAETEELAVISGLVTDTEMRGHGLGRAITASTWNLVLTEGKRGLAYLGADNENTLSLHHKMGYDFLGLYARLLRED